MKKMKIALALFATVITTFSTVHIIQAAEESNATVTFTANTAIVPPVDPLDPDEPGTEEGTGMEGALTLDFIPTLPFGSHVISGGVETYETTNTKPYIQVTDKSGLGEGWNVTAQLGEFTSVDDDTLETARLDFSNGNITAPSSNTSLAPTGNATFSLTSGSVPPTKFISAAIGKGMGTWIETWLSADPLNDTTNANVELVVGTSDAYAKVYTAVMTWNVQVAP